MGMELPGAIAGPLGWVGMEWPKGDESAMDRLNDDWERFARNVSAIQSELNSVAGGIGHSIDGDMQTALDAQLKAILSGDQSLEKLITQAADIAECCNTMSNEILVLKVIFITELVALATYVAFLVATSEFNWSAPIEIAQAVLEGRLTLTEAVELVARRILAKLLEKGIEEFGSASTKEMAKLLGKDLLHNVRGKAFNAAIIEGSKKLAFTSLDQVRDNVLWDKPMDPKELIEKTTVSAVTGAALSPIAAKVDDLVTNRGDDTAKGLVNILGPGRAADKPSARQKAIEPLVGFGNWWGKDTLPGKLIGPATKYAEERIVGPGLESNWERGEQPGTEEPHSIPSEPSAERSGASPSIGPASGPIVSSRDSQTATPAANGTVPGIAP
ncbi:hypothetical protein GTV32_15155 [Gordonia sp. SID5947]|uniref:WXG100-like domain-containing protein n=1 Tax=Gordonia sp. SID5947 TaxID=2690315 RepID=UPI00136ECB3E|nr:hypothetical protein [Gordonia sp. SID5947]MYR07558.1 hypothetical protein [Gordonia sp. SID5947]